MKDNNTPMLQAMSDDVQSSIFSYIDWQGMLDMRATSHHFHTPPPSICKTITQAFEEFKKKVPLQSREELEEKTKKLLVNFAIIASFTFFYTLRNLSRIMLLVNSKEFFACIIFGIAPSLFFFCRLSPIPKLFNTWKDVALATKEIETHKTLHILKNVMTLYNKNKTTPHNEEDQDIVENLVMKTHS